VISVSDFHDPAALESVFDIFRIRRTAAEDRILAGEHLDPDDSVGIGDPFRSGIASLAGRAHRRQQGRGDKQFLFHNDFCSG